MAYNATFFLLFCHFQADVTLVDLQRRCFCDMMCCAKNRSGVTCHLVRVFSDICSGATCCKFLNGFQNLQRNCVKLISVTSLSSIFAATLIRRLSANCATTTINWWKLLVNHSTDKLEELLFVHSVKLGEMFHVHFFSWSKILSKPSYFS